MKSIIRSSVLAGEWYPRDPHTLEKMIRSYMDRVSPQKSLDSILGLVSPHAGYVYSGFTAAHGYKQLIGRHYDVVVIFSPFHGYPIGRYMINTADAYETPLGTVPVHKEIVEALQQRVDLTFIDTEEEHSIEIQLPFLQVALKNFSIVPIMVGHRDVEDVEDMVSAINSVLLDKNPLIVASTDLHHLHSYHEVVSRDALVVDAIASMDLNRIRNILAPETCTVCGKVPVSIVTDVVKRMGAKRCVVLYRSNSKDEYKDIYPGTYTVGYVSAVFVGS